MRTSQLVYPQLSYVIVGACFDAHNKLGQYAREKQYADFLEKYFKEKDIAYNRELIVGETGNRVDFLIEEKIILELKAKECISRDDYFQIKRYLDALDMRLGILVNFRQNYIHPKRVLRGDPHDE